MGERGRMVYTYLPEEDQIRFKTYCVLNSISGKKVLQNLIMDLLTKSRAAKQTIKKGSVNKNVKKSVKV